MSDLVKISDIRLDLGTQMRAFMRSELIQEYKTILDDEGDLDAITLFDDGMMKICVDGFHRIETYKLANRTEIPAEIKQGTLQEAILFAAGVNTKHGARRTLEDKWSTVRKILAYPEWSILSNRWLALKCGVSITFIGRVREQVEGEEADPPWPPLDSEVEVRPEDSELPSESENSVSQATVDTQDSLLPENKSDNPLSTWTVDSEESKPSQEDSAPQNNQVSKMDTNSTDTTNTTKTQNSIPTKTSPKQIITPPPVQKTQRIGLDGRTYTINKPDRGNKPSKAPQPPPDAGDAWEPPVTPQEQQKDAEVTSAANTNRDTLGYPIPKELKDIFADKTLSESNQVLKLLLQKVRSNQVLYPYIPLALFTDLVNGLTSMLDKAQPHCVHQKCSGVGCEECRTCGYLTQWRLEELQSVPNISE